MLKLEYFNLSSSKKERISICGDKKRVLERNSAITELVKSSITQEKQFSGLSLMNGEREDLR